jgi:aconitase A
MDLSQVIRLVSAPKDPQNASILEHILNQVINFVPVPVF